VADEGRTVCRRLVMSCTRMGSDSPWRPVLTTSSIFTLIKNKKVRAIASLVAGGAALSSGLCGGHSHVLAQTPDDFVSRPFVEVNEQYWFSGDTFSLKIPHKNGSGTRSQHFRLYGINTPEPDSTREHELRADMARFDLSRQQVLDFGNHVRQALQRTLQEGGTVKTRRQPAEKLDGRKYDYALVYDQRQRDIAILLLEAGYAVVDETVARSIANEFPRNKKHPLLLAQERAVHARRGLWALTRHPAQQTPPTPATDTSPAEPRGLPTPDLGKKRWTLYEDGHHVPQAYAGDGDSFALTSTQGRATVWRLYGVDCPETSHHIPARVKEQAQYFDVSEQSIITWGKRAAAFTAQFLSREPVNIYTVHEDALGSGSKRRYYAMIRSAAHDEDLALALVSRGLAAARSKRLPSRSRSAQAYHEALQQAELRARLDKRGVWGG